MEQFDLFTFLALIANFVVLVVLLRLILYKRITKAMDSREEQIATRWDDAEEAKRRAEEQQREIEEKNRELEEKRRKREEEAFEEVEEKRRELMANVREEVAAQRRDWFQALDREREVFLRSLREEVAEELTTLLRNAFQEMANTRLEEQMTEVFVRRLSSDREEIEQYIKEAGSKITISSSEELDEQSKDRIRECIRKMDPGREPDFSLDEKLICGIELSTNGRKISWTLAQYVDDFAERLTSSIEEGETERG